MMKKRGLCAILAAVLLFQLVFPIAAGAAEDVNETGRISIFTENAPGQEDWDAVLHNGELILLSPYDIGTIAGAAVYHDEAENTYELARDRYRVCVDMSRKEARIYLDLTETGYAEPYGRAFPLEYTGQVEMGGGEADVLPLEQMFYLLNVQWVCRENCVYTFAPKETLWNVVGEFQEMVGNLPTRADVLGSSVGDYWGNSFMYSILAFGDEVDPLTLVPCFGEKYWDGKKTEEALLALSVPAANLQNGMAEEAGGLLGAYLDDLGTLVGDIAKVTEGTASEIELLTKAFTAWSDFETPASLSSTLTGASLASGIVEGNRIARRYIGWGEGFIQQLEYLKDVQNEDFAQYCKVLNKQAEGLYSEYGNLLGNTLWEGGKALLGTLGSTLLGMTPVGRAFAAYDAVTTSMGALFPVVAAGFESGDQASVAVKLCDLASLMRRQYANTLDGAMGSVDQEALDGVRLTGSLLMSASEHSRDALYSALRAMLLSGMKEQERSEEAVRASVVMDTSMSELAGELMRDSVNVMRFQETSQYDPSLLLYRDWRNLYSSVSGATREKIPPEYVRYGAPHALLLQHRPV